MFKNSTINRWIERIKEAYLADDSVLADSLMKQALVETGSASRLLEISGIIAYHQGNVQESIRLIEAAMFEIGLSISGQLTLANAWLQTGDFDSTRTTVTFLVDIIERVPCSMLPDLTHLLSAIQEYELAIAVCREAYERNPDDDNAVFGAAFYMDRAGYPVELVKSMMLKAVDMKPSSQLYRANLAVVCSAMGQWEIAYSHACRLSDAALKSLPCRCMAKQIAELFSRFQDVDRLEKTVFSD